MSHKIYYLIFSVVLISRFFLPQSIFAKEYRSFVTPVFPIRGPEFWTLNDQSPYDNFRNYRELVDRHKLSATWLFRYDALFDDQIYTTARLFSENQERGLFLEITPNLVKDAGVEYPSGGGWSDSHRVFISGYTLVDRQLLIDTATSEFLKVYGHFPQVVAAWHIDAWSANYLFRSYGIKSIIVCADQYATDQYQIWGGWWGGPYYPSRNNILVPAQSLDYKLPIVISQWASRDPTNGYGGSVWESTFSVQANDYLIHKLDVNYFEKLLNIYTQNSNNQFGYLLVGIENDYDWKLYGNQIDKQLSVVSQWQTEGKIQTVTLSGFSTWYQQTYPGLSPSHQIASSLNDENNQPVNPSQPISESGEKTVTWEMTPYYRLAYQTNNDQFSVFDYRVYDQRYSEPYLETKNQFSQLHLVVPAEIDTVTFPQQTKILQSAELEQLRHPLSPKLPFQADLIPIVLWYLILLIFVFFYSRKNFVLGFLLLIGSITISLPLVKSGWLYPYGMGFWGPNGHDGIWHLSLIEHFSRSWNFTSPVLSGTQLSNYHFLFDIFSAIINRLTPFWSASTLYFQILPPTLAVLLGVTVYRFTRKWTQSKLSAYLALLLVYFGGGWGWVITWIRDQTLGGESMFWSTQAISTLINPPFALSVIILLLGLNLLITYQFKPNKKLVFIITILFGLLFQTKAYAGILLLSSLAIISLIEILQKSFKQAHLYKIWIGASVLTIITALPLLNLSQKAFIFQPLWFPHTMLQFNDRLSWTKLAQARQAYWATNNIIKGLTAELVALTIFIGGNLGIRIIGVLYIFKKINSWIKSKSSINYLDLVLILITLEAIIIPLVFVQTGTAWNTIQFFYYAMIFMALFSAKVIGSWLERINKKPLRVTIFIILFLFNLPTTIGTLKQYLPYRAPARIPYEELSALEKLRQQPPGTVLTYPFNQVKVSNYEAPKPLAYYASTAYVSAMSGHPVYLEDEINLELISAEAGWKTRKDLVQNLFMTLNDQTVNQFLDQNQVKYLYLLKGQNLNLHPDQLKFEKFFDNGLVTVYKRN